MNFMDDPHWFVEGRRGDEHQITPPGVEPFPKMGNSGTLQGNFVFPEWPGHDALCSARSLHTVSAVVHDLLYRVRCPSSGFVPGIDRRTIWFGAVRCFILFCELKLRTMYELVLRIVSRVFVPCWALAPLILSCSRASGLRCPTALWSSYFTEAIFRKWLF